MGSIDGYIVRTTLGAFIMVLLSLTGVIWITQALRGIDLMTSQGQTILVFIGFTGLAVPSLILIIAPIALVIAVAYVLNKLATDSEIIVMNAAGLQPWGLFRPFFFVATLVSLAVLALSFYIAPEGLRRLKQWDYEIAADVISNVMQTSRFMELDGGLTIFVRERQPGGRMVNIFIDDRRNPKERDSIIADHGFVVKNPQGTFIILEDGTLQRFEAGKRDPALVAFESYAFDMSKFTNLSKNIVYSTRERYFWQLITPDPNDPVYIQNPGQFTAEFHDRLVAPLYPLIFVMLTFAFLGAPRTTRQSRGFSITSSVAAVGGLRVAGFACSVLTMRTPVAAYVQYAMLAATLVVSAYVISKAVILEPPPALTEAISRWTERLARRFAPA
jgi:lipopolysaccharide export system permease protein